MSTAKLKKEVIKHLTENPLSLSEIAVKMELKEKKVFRLLRSLFEGSEVTSFRGSDGVRKYRLTNDEEKSKNKASETKEAEVDVDDDDDDEEDE
jgi:hypothetical protein